MEDTPLPRIILSSETGRFALYVGDIRLRDLERFVAERGRSPWPQLHIEDPPEILMRIRQDAGDEEPEEYAEAAARNFGAQRAQEQLFVDLEDDESVDTTLLPCEHHAWHSNSSSSGKGDCRRSTFPAFDLGKALFEDLSGDGSTLECLSEAVTDEHLDECSRLVYLAYAQWANEVWNALSAEQVLCADVRVIVFSPAGGLGRTARDLVAAWRLALTSGRLLLLDWEEPIRWDFGLDMPWDGFHTSGTPGFWNWDGSTLGCRTGPGPDARFVPILALVAEGLLSDSLLVETDWERLEAEKSLLADAAIADGDVGTARRVMLESSGVLQLPGATVAHVDGHVDDDHWLHVERRRNWRRVHRYFVARSAILGVPHSITQTLYQRLLDSMPTESWLLRALIRPSEDVAAFVEHFSGGLDRSIVVAMHVRTGMGDWGEERAEEATLSSQSAFLEPWDVDLFFQCWRSMVASHYSDGATPDEDADHSLTFRPDRYVDYMDKWESRVATEGIDSVPFGNPAPSEGKVLFMSDASALHRTARKAFGGRRVVSIPGRTAHTLVARDASALLKTYAEFFLMEYADYAVLTAWSEFGEAAALRARLPRSRRLYINHSHCGSKRHTPLPCKEPTIPRQCVGPAGYVELFGHAALKTEL
jgi:hypothetical protein